MGCGGSGGGNVGNGTLNDFTNNFNNQYNNGGGTTPPVSNPNTDTINTQVTPPVVPATPPPVTTNTGYTVDSPNYINNWIRGYGGNTAWDANTNTATITIPGYAAYQWRSGTATAPGMTNVGGRLYITDPTAFLGSLTKNSLTNNLSQPLTTQQPQVVQNPYGMDQSAFNFNIPTNPYQGTMESFLNRANELSNSNMDITSSPYYQAGLAAAKQTSAEMGQDVMENMNQRGILNSTVTVDNVAQANNKVMTELLPVLIEKAYGIRQNDIQNLISMAQNYAQLGNQWYNQQVQANQVNYERARQAKLDEVAIAQQAIENRRLELADALKSIETTGVITAKVAMILGDARLVGQQPWVVKEKILEENNKLNIAAANNKADWEQLVYSNQQQNYRNAQDNATSRANNAASNATSTYNTNLRINNDNAVAKPATRLQVVTRAQSDPQWAIPSKRQALLDMYSNMLGYSGPQITTSSVATPTPTPAPKTNVSAKPGTQKPKPATNNKPKTTSTIDDDILKYKR